MSRTQMPNSQMRADPNAIIGKGGQHAIRFAPRGDKDPHIMVELWSEDDETWSITDSYSSAWHAELLAAMEAADRVLKSSKPDPDGCGFTGTPGKNRKTKNWSQK